VGKFSAGGTARSPEPCLSVKEFLGALDLDLDIVVAGLGSNPDFLDMNLVLLLLAEFFFWVYLNLP